MSAHRGPMSMRIRERTNEHRDGSSRESEVWS